MNRGLGKKSAKNTSRNGSTEGLSEMAKKTIIKNISSHHKSTFCMTSKENQPNQVVNKNSLIHESYKTHESNLLTSYKWLFFYVIIFADRSKNFNFFDLNIQWWLDEKIENRK